MRHPLLLGRAVTSADDVFVIADIGKNFIQTKEDRPMEEYIRNAKVLVDAAVEAGVDVVKFQTHVVDDEQLDVRVEAPHFKGHDRFAWVKRNTDATPLAFWQELKAYCETKGVPFFSTPMSRKAAEKLTSIGVPLWKVASGDVRDLVLLNYIISTKLPIIFSTGMVSLAELDQVMKHLRPSGVPLTVLYCVSKYPCPPEHFNLATIDLFRRKYPDVRVGFSDHSIGHDVALAAAKIGASVIEKHFSLSRDLWGPDHKVSMTPQEMTAMMRAIRSKEYLDVDSSAYYGQEDRELEGAANEFRPYFLKSLVAGKDIAAGTSLTEEMLYAMRPLAFAGGLPSEELPSILGRTLARDVRQYDPITSDLLS